MRSLTLVHELTDALLVVLTVVLAAQGVIARREATISETEKRSDTRLIRAADDREKGLRIRCVVAGASTGHARRPDIALDGLGKRTAVTGCDERGLERPDDYVPGPGPESFSLEVSESLGPRRSFERRVAFDAVGVAVVTAVMGTIVGGLLGTTLVERPVRRFVEKVCLVGSGDFGHPVELT